MGHIVMYAEQELNHCILRMKCRIVCFLDIHFVTFKKIKKVVDKPEQMFQYKKQVKNICSDKKENEDGKR